MNDLAKKARLVNKVFGLTLAIMALMSWSLASRAQTPTGPVTGDYLLGAEDVIEVLVTNHNDLNRVVTIRPDGMITLPRAGELLAAGKTAKVLAAKIQEILAKDLNHAEVMVIVKEVHSRKARVVGAVKVPGTFDLKTGWRLLDLIAAADGLVVKPSRVSGRIIRAGVVINCDIQTALREPQNPTNIVVQPNDLLVLDEQDVVNRRIHVIGKSASQAPMISTIT